MSQFATGERVEVRNNDSEEWIPAKFWHVGGWFGQTYYDVTGTNGPYVEGFKQIRKIQES